MFIMCWRRVAISCYCSKKRMRSWPLPISDTPQNTYNFYSYPKSRCDFWEIHRASGLIFLPKIDLFNLLENKLIWLISIGIYFKVYWRFLPSRNMTIISSLKNNRHLRKWYVSKYLISLIVFIRAVLCNISKMMVYPDF